MHPHPLFTAGPVVFVALSFLASVALAPRAMRLAAQRQARRGDPFGLRSPRLTRAACILGTTAAVWMAATAVGGVLLLVPWPDSARPLPGAAVDPAMIAHAVPPLSGVAAERLVVRLERAPGASRWSPPGELEQRLVLAARIDPSPGRAVERLARAGFRSRAGGFATQRPSAATCDAGLPALAEALRGGALRDLMVACRNAPGDGVGHAAFVVGDFMRAVGPEAESIVSRQPRSPVGEGGCFAGGFDVPPPDLPLCRLVHAELKREARAEVLAAAPAVPRYAARWAAAMHRELDPRAPGPEPLTIDPVALVERPGEALLDEPIAILEDQRARGLGATAVERAWMALAVAASRSAAGRHDRARDLVEEALRELDAAGVDEEHRAAAARLAVAIALRADDRAALEIAAPLLDETDPLVAHLRWALGHGAPPGWPAWVQAVAEGAPGAAIAEALVADPARATTGLLRLARVPDAERAPLREWLREAFPPCERCGFFERLAHHEARLDAAHALDDEALIEVLAPIVARFEAVVMNRGLGLSLRAAHRPMEAGDGRTPALRR